MQVTIIVTQWAEQAKQTAYSIFYPEANTNRWDNPLFVLKGGNLHSR